MQHLPGETFDIFHLAGNESGNPGVLSLITRAGSLVELLVLRLYLLMFLKDGILFRADGLLNIHCLESLEVLVLSQVNCSSVVNLTQFLLLVMMMT